MAATTTLAIHILYHLKHDIWVQVPGTGIQLSKPTSDFKKAITFGGIALDSNID